MTLIVPSERETLHRHRPLVGHLLLQHPFYFRLFTRQATPTPTPMSTPTPHDVALSFYPFDKRRDGNRTHPIPSKPNRPKRNHPFHAQTAAVPSPGHCRTESFPSPSPWHCRVARPPPLPLPPRGTPLPLRSGSNPGEARNLPSRSLQQPRSPRSTWWKGKPPRRGLPREAEATSVAAAATAAAAAAAASTPPLAPLPLPPPLPPRRLRLSPEEVRRPHLLRSRSRSRG